MCNIEEEFSAYSTKHAATSKAFKNGLDVNVIKKAAGWFENSRVFSRFYNRSFIDTSENFADKVCNKV